jgi:hypothetical protein
MKFKDLDIGAVFNFVGSWHGPCKKISARRYVDEPDKREETAKELGRIYNIPNYKIDPHEVGTINVEVARREP